MKIGIGYSTNDVPRMLFKALAHKLTLPKAVKTYPHFLSTNPATNRAARRRVFKLRGTPPLGVSGKNQRERVLLWQAKKAAFNLLLGEDDAASTTAP